MESMGRKKIENRAELIIEAANKLFVTYGYDRTTVEEIAKEAGISKAGLYLEFKTKEDILQAVIRGFARQEIARFEMWAAEPNVSPLAVAKNVLISHFSSLFDFVKSHQHGFEVAMVHSVNRQQPIVEEVDCRTPPFIVAKLLEQAAEKGEILKQSNYVWAGRIIFLTLVRFSSPPYPAFVTPEIFRDDIEQIIDMMLSSLKTLQR
jgi:AcrR family transcriptional regulator